jgi:hypothetical protein
VQITLNAGLVFGTNRDWVVQVWPAAGTRRFIDDLLLRLTVRQFVLEVHDSEEAGYQGYGPKFTEQANRIGRALELPPVLMRRRATSGPQAVASGWPHCVRPACYYGDDLTAAALRRARGECAEKETVGALAEQGLLEVMQHLMAAGRVEQAQQLVERQLEWLLEAEQGVWPARSQVEAGCQDTDGAPLGGVTFDAEWLAWNGGTVRRLAEGVMKSGSFANLPLLADALVEAGCSDGRILRHLRERMRHSRRCWVLRRLLGCAADCGTPEVE